MTTLYRNKELGYGVLSVILGSLTWLQAGSSIGLLLESTFMCCGGSLAPNKQNTTIFLPLKLLSQGLVTLFYVTLL